MRIKAVWKEHKFVVPLGKTTNKVSDLYNSIAAKFTPYSAEEFQVAELRTIDGFIISPHYTIDESIVDNEILVIVDFDSWKNEQYKLCNKTFATIKLENFESDEEIKVNIGLNTLNKLYVSIGLYSKLFRLELFDSSDLKEFHKPGEHQITHWEDGKGNNARVYFVVVDGIVVQAKVEISTESSPKPLIKTLDLKIGGKSIEAGDLVTIQEAYQSYDADSKVEVTESKSGESYKDYEEYDYYTTDGGNEDTGVKAIVTGDSNVRYEQVDIVRAEMHNWPVNGEHFHNSFFTDFQITNNSADRITLSKVTAEYQDKQGEWKPMQAYFGVKRGNSPYDYNWKTDNTLIPLESRDTIKLSTNARLEIAGKNNEKLKRSHCSLPNKINIRLHVHDDKQTITTIPLVYKNKTEDPVCVTLKYKQQQVSDQIVFFQTVDNFDLNCRGYVQITKSKDGERNIFHYSSSCSNSTYYIYESTLHKFVYDAKKAGNHLKFKIDNYSSESSTFAVVAYANVNFETSKVESLTFELSNIQGTSKSTKTFPILKLSN